MQRTNLSSQIHPSFKTHRSAKHQHTEHQLTEHQPIEQLESRRLLAASISIGALNDTAFRQSGEEGIIVVSRRGDLSSDVTVPLTVFGSAANGTDYGRVGNEVVIPAGTRSVALKIRPAYTGLSSASEFMSVAIGQVAGYRLGANVASVSLLDNSSSQRPVISNNPNVLVTSMRTANDMRRGTAGRFVLTRTGDLSELTTVPLTVGGTAVNGTDFGVIGNSVTFQPGVSELVINVRSSTPLFIGDRTVTLSTGALPGALPTTPSTSSNLGLGGTATSSAGTLPGAVSSSSLVLSGVATSSAGTLPGAATGAGTRVSPGATVIGSRFSTVPVGVGTPTSTTTRVSTVPTTSTVSPTTPSSRFGELPGAVATGTIDGRTQFGTTGIGTSFGTGFGVGTTVSRLDS